MFVRSISLDTREALCSISVNVFHSTINIYAVITSCNYIISSFYHHGPRLRYNRLARRGLSILKMTPKITKRISSGTKITNRSTRIIAPIVPPINPITEPMEPKIVINTPTPNKIRIINANRTGSRERCCGRAQGGTPGP
jgi:hypothetical protein